MHRDKILFKCPIYTGLCILDLFKTLMYDFYYKHLKLKYGPRVDLLYTDTDSLLLEIKTEDVYKEMENLRDELYDTSDYPKSHPLHSQLNKKVIGKMKDECAGKPISEVVCLRSKMYSILLEGEKNIKKAKGTTKVVTKKEITRTTRRPYSASEPSSTGWTGSKAKATRSLGSISTRQHFPPLTPNAGSRRMVFTRWHTGTKTYASPANAGPTNAIPTNASPALEACRWQLSAQRHNH